MGSRCERVRIESLYHCFQSKWAFELFLDSEYRGALSEAVLRLQEQGKLSVNKIKWWKEKRGGGACDVICDCIWKPSARGLIYELSLSGLWQR